MDSGFFDNIYQILQVFTGSNCNSCMNQIQNEQLQEILTPNSNLLQLPSFNSKDFQQLHSIIAPNNSDKILNPHGFNTIIFPSDGFFTHMNYDCCNLILTFLSSFSQKIPIFQTNDNQSDNSTIIQLQKISHINPKKLTMSTNSTMLFTPSSVESESICRFTLASFLSFIGSILQSNINHSVSDSNRSSSSNDSPPKYEFNNEHYSLLFQLFILSFQTQPIKQQIIESLIIAFIILFESFVYESYQIYKIAYPQSNGVSYTLSKHNSEKCFDESEVNSVNESLFGDETFCMILEKIQNLIISFSVFFFPKIDKSFESLICMIGLDKKTQLTQFDVYLMKFITVIATKTHQYTFSKETIRQLILYTSNHLLKYNKICLDLFISLSKHTDDSSNSDVIEMIVSTLMNEIKKEKTIDLNSSIIRLNKKENKGQIIQQSDVELLPPHNFFNESFQDSEISQKLNLKEHFEINKNAYQPLVAERIYDIIQILAESFHSSSSMLDKLYISIGKTISKSNQNLFDEFCLFLVFYLEANIKWHFEPTKVHNPAIFLSLPYLFSKFILTKPNKAPNLLRKFVIGILIDTNEKELLKIFDMIESSYENKVIIDDSNIPASPLFVLEMIETLIFNYKKLIILLTNISDSIVKPLCHIMNEMRLISYSNNLENSNQKVHYTNFKSDVDCSRYAFLVLIQLLFENNEVKKLLIDNDSFAITYIDFIFEGEDVRKYILHQLENALIEPKCSPAIAFVPNITQAFKTIIEYSNRNIEESIKLITEVLLMMNEVLLQRPGHCKSFAQLYSSIFDILIFINRLFQSENNLDLNLIESLFKESIEFLASITFFIQINDQNINIMKNTVSLIYKSNEAPHWLYQSLIRLMVTNGNHIKHPSVLHLIFEFYNNDEFLKLLCQLMDNNISNARNAKSVGFDEVVLDCLMSDPSNLKNSTLIKELFTKLSLTAISSNAIYKFLEHLSPKNGKYLNKHTDLYINYLSDLFSLSLETQHESLPLNPGMEQVPVTINTNSTNKTNDGLSFYYGDGYFTVVFWLLVEEMSPTYYPCIFSAIDEKGNIYEVFIRMRKICINYDNTHKKASLVFNQVLNTNQWHFISLTFSKQEEKFGEIESKSTSYCITSMSINGKTDILYTLKFPASRMITGNAVFTFGGVLHDNSIKATRPCCLGPYAIFNSIIRNEKSLYNQEQRFFCRDKKDKSLCLVYQPYMYGPRQNQKSFASTIVLNIKLEVFIPLFLLAPLKFEDGTEFHNLMETVLRILKYGLSFGSVVEESFALSNGFGIISFILQLDKYHKYCDYNLYMQFYSLFQNLMNERLKISIITSILLNFDIWATIEKEEEKIQIFDHWLYSIFPLNIQLIIQQFTFSDLLNKIIYYFHSKEDKHLIKYKYKLPQINNSFWCSKDKFEFDDENSIENINETNTSDANLKTILDILFQCLLVAVDTIPSYVTFDDYSLLISYLCKSHSCDLLFNLVKLITQMIISGDPPSICSAFKNDTAIPRLHQIFTSSSNICSIGATLEIIVSLHKTKMIYTSKFFNHLFYDFSMNMTMPNSIQPCTLTEHLYIIMHQIPREIFGNAAFFKLLVNLKDKGMTSVFLLLCWSAICLIDDNKDYINPDFETDKIQYLNSILTKIEPSHDFVHPNWELIPIILVFKAKNVTFANAMIKFLLGCCQGDEWKSLYGSLSLISNVFQSSSYKYHRIYIKLMLAEFMRKKNENGPDELLVALVSNYLFYCEPRYFNISKFFEESPFKDYKDDIHEEEKTATIEKFTSFFDLIKFINNDKSIYGRTTNVFRIRLNKNTGKWIDRDIAKLLFQYLSQFSKQDTTQKLRFLLIYFLLNQNDDPSILKYLKELGKPQMSNSFNNNNSIVTNIKNQEGFQMLIDLLCSQLEKNGIQDEIPLFELRSKNFRENGQNFLKSIDFTFDFKYIYDSIISSSYSFMMKIDMASNKLIKCASPQQPQLPNIFLIDMNQQQPTCPKELYPFLDRSYLPSFDSSSFYVNSQRLTVIKTINQMYSFKRSFKQLFESLTANGAPFHSLLEFTLYENSEKRLKRDKTLIAQLIPLRMKTNWSMNNFPIKNEKKEDKSIMTFPSQFTKNKKPLALKKLPSYGLFSELQKPKAPSKISNKKKLSKSTCVVRYETNNNLKNCGLVQIDKIDDVYISLSKHSFQMVKCKNMKLIQVNYSDIKYFNKTTFYHKQVSIQVITNAGDEYFLTFKTEDIRDKIFDVISPLVKNSTYQFLSTLDNSTQHWIDENITNFEYLMKLNMTAGRSFQNSSQYPLFPIILSSFDNALNLNDNTAFRDLSKPSGALNERKFEILKKNQESLMKLGSNKTAFLFSSYASNPQIVFSELARIEPFTSLFVSLAEGKLEDKEKFGLLTSITSLYNNILKDQMDFRELLPEFFMISPEFLQKTSNEANLKFGDVGLPSFASTAIDFLYMHRKSLEAKFVRNNLNNWIDLIFGCLQRSENNNYDPALYPDIWDDLEKEELKQIMSDNSNQEKQNVKQKSKINNASLNQTERKVMDLIVKDLSPTQNEVSNSSYTRLKEIEASKRILGQVPLKIFGRPHKQSQLINLIRRRKTLMPADKSLTPRKSTNQPIQLKNQSSYKLSGSQIDLTKIEASISIKHPKVSKLTSFDFSKDDFEIGFSREEKNPISTELKEMRDNFFGIKKIDLKRDNLVFASTSHDLKLLKIQLVDENGNRYIVSIDTSSNEIVETKTFSDDLSKLIYDDRFSKENREQKFSKKNMAIFNSSLAVNTDNGIVLLSQNSKQIQLKSNSEIPKYNPVDTFVKKFKLLESDSHSLVLIGNDSIINVFDEKGIDWNKLPDTTRISNVSIPAFMNYKYRRLHFFNKSKIACGSVSTKMNTLAVAATDGIVLLYSLYNGSTIIPIELPKNFVANSIVITQSLGFVVIDAIYNSTLTDDSQSLEIKHHSKIHSLFVFTINGEFVRRRAISLNDDDDILLFTSFTSKKGIDYIAFVTKIGYSFHVCEAFLLNLEDFASPNEIISEAHSSKIPQDQSQMTDEQLIQYQINLPFPTLMNFDAEPICLDFSKTNSSITYITKNGELGFIPIDKLIKENF